jgi:glycosyltransferase 2 family protein
MKKKQIITSIVVVAILAGLVYIQVKAWRHFDWEKFRMFTASVNPWGILLGVAVIYTNYFLRATRWRVFLRSRQSVRALDLVPSQIIGFTGLALLGRPGEFIRPYLIARKLNLSFASQLVVWTAERLCDMCSVATILAITLLLRPDFRRFFVLPHVRAKALVALAVVVLLVAALFTFSRAVREKTRRLFADLSRSVAHDFISFIEISATSLGMWALIAASYFFTLHAYPQLHGKIGITDVPLIMGASVFGSIIQLPGVGGGSQLAVISILSSPVFGLQQELAVSAGIMLWLVTFASVTPTGLFLAHREKLSLTRLSSASQNEEQTAEAEA